MCDTCNGGHAKKGEPTLVQSPLDSMIALSAAAMKSNLTGNVRLEVGKARSEMRGIESDVWQADLAFDGPNVPRHPRRRWMAVVGQLRLHLGKRSRAPHRSADAKVSDEFGGKPVVDEPLMPP